MPDNVVIDMGQLNDVLNKEHALEFFALLKKDIEDGLTHFSQGWHGGNPADCEWILRRHFETTHDRLKRQSASGCLVTLCGLAATLLAGYIQTCRLLS